jgi:SAM-dependent methyltransferase
VLDLTYEYYQQHASIFFDDTVEVDMNALYRRFLPRLPDQAHILDAGCGSARDASAFAKLGHRVTAFDASPALIALAETHLGQPVQCLRFQDITWQEQFDGIWACASLLHVPAAELADVMRRLCKALKPDGVIYASFKYGSGEREHHGRHFTDLDEPGLAALLRQVLDLKEVETWTTSDLRPGREAERWLNTLLHKTE